MSDLLELLSPRFYWRLARLLLNSRRARQMVEIDTKRAREARRR